MSTVKLKTAALRDGLSAIASVRDLKTSRDVLKKVLLQLAPGTLTLGASDAELTARLTLEVEGAAPPLACLIAPERMLVVLRETTATDCSLEVKLDSIVLRCGGSRIELQTADAGNFVPLPEWETEACFTCETADLVRAVAQSEFATDTSSTRFQCSGVSFDSRGAALHLAATDSRRLSVNFVLALTRQGDSPAGIGQSWIVGARHMKTLTRLLPGRSTEFFFTDSDAAFRSGGLVAAVRMISGRFPDWRRVVPSAATTTIKTVAGPLLSLMRQAQIVLCPETGGVDLTFAEGTLCVSGAVADIGQGDFELPVEQDGPAITIRLVHEYVVQWLATLPRESPVEIGLIDSESASLWTAGHSRYVLMPLQE